MSDLVSKDLVLISFSSFLIRIFIFLYLFDKFGYQPIMKIIGFCCSGMSIFFYFFIDDKLFYVIGLIIAISTLIGIMSAATPHLMNIYQQILMKWIMMML